VFSFIVLLLDNILGYAATCDIVNYFQRTFTMHLLWKMNNYLQMNHSVDNIVFNALRISEKLSTARKQI